MVYGMVHEYGVWCMVYGVWCMVYGAVVPSKRVHWLHLEPTHLERASGSRQRKRMKEATTIKWTARVSHAMCTIIDCGGWWWWWWWWWWWVWG
jgi:hypothetical protein